MSRDRMRVWFDVAQALIGCGLLGVLIRTGATIERIDSALGQSVTIQDAVSWERELVISNPQIHSPDIRAIHAENAEQAGRSVLRR